MSDMEASRRRAKLWTMVPYDGLEQLLVPGADDLVKFSDIGEGDEVLDVACGTGNVALTAHRHGADVTAVDINAELIEQAEERADLIDADVEFREGNALDLPFEDDSFDVTVSAFGHNLTGDPMRATEELVRVTRPGGRVAFATYAKDGSVGEGFEIIDSYLPDEESATDSVDWGDPAFLEETMSDLVDDVEIAESEVRLNAVSPAHAVERFVSISGVLQKYFDVLGDNDQFRQEMVENADRHFERNAQLVEFVMVEGTA